MDSLTSNSFQIIIKILTGLLDFLNIQAQSTTRVVVKLPFCVFSAMAIFNHICLTLNTSFARLSDLHLSIFAAYEIGAQRSHREFRSYWFPLVPVYPSRLV